MHIAKHQRLDGAYLLVLAGELDTSAAAPVGQAGIGLLGHDGCNRLVVDLMDVSFIDCSGIGALIVLRNAARDLDVPLVILDPSARVVEVLRLTGLEQYFDVELTMQKSGNLQVE
jgi:anti-anti-sigma factor